MAFAEQRGAQILASSPQGRRAPLASPWLAFLLVDLDNFKSVNDRFGHAAGDTVLTTFASIATRTFRAHDVVARWGGEEFLVILEVQQACDAHAAAERLRSALCRAAFAVGNQTTIPVTCSIGVAVLAAGSSDESDATWHDALRRADHNLYRAKSAGRNRVCWTDMEAVATVDPPRAPPVIA